MDRTAFRHILMDYTIKKRQLYENFLENVPILSSLNYYERTIIADALESFKFGDGEVIIRQGEEGDKFYIIEEVNKHQSDLLINNHQSRVWWL
jgi:hypothetical protein